MSAGIGHRPSAIRPYSRTDGPSIQLADPALTAGPERRSYSKFRRSMPADNDAMVCVRIDMYARLESRKTDFVNNAFELLQTIALRTIRSYFKICQGNNVLCRIAEKIKRR